MSKLAIKLSPGDWEIDNQPDGPIIFSNPHGVSLPIAAVSQEVGTDEATANAQVIRAAKALYLAATNIMQWLPFPGENIPGGHLEAILKLTKAIELAETPIE